MSPEYNFKFDVNYDANMRRYLKAIYAVIDAAAASFHAATGNTIDTLDIKDHVEWAAQDASDLSGDDLTPAYWRRVLDRLHDNKHAHVIWDALRAHVGEWAKDSLTSMGESCRDVV